MFVEMSYTVSASGCRTFSPDILLAGIVKNLDNSIPNRNPILVSTSSFFLCLSILVVLEGCPGGGRTFKD